MTDLFHAVLNMSVTAAVVISAVALIRLPLSKAPKAITCGLWFVALFRLLCPVSFHSAVSLFNLRGTPSMTYIQPSFQAFSSPAVSVADLSAAPVNAGTVFPATMPEAVKTGGSSVTVLSVLALIWAAVAAGLLLYGIVSYFRLRRRIGTATRVEGNIYETDRIVSPFVAGLFRPAIFLPVGLGGGVRTLIIEHEKTHIARRDYITKLLWYLAVCIHWFNPLVWVAFYLVGRDMEMRCDEAVVRKLGNAVKADYSDALLALSAPRKFFAANPLAFGEGSLISRIKKVLNFKRPVTWVVVAALAATVVLTIVLAANPMAPAAKKSLVAQLLGYKTEYIGDNSKVGGIISLLSFPSAVQYDSFALQTRDKPYGITINLRADDAAKALLAKVDNRVWLRRDAALLFSLVGNADTVSFSLSGTDDPAPLNITYTRGDIDKLYGPDVRTYVTDERSLSEFEKKLDILANAVLSAADVSAAAATAGGPVQTAPPAASADSGQTVAVDYGLFRLGKNGVVLGALSLLNAEQKTIVREAIASFMLKSAAWPAVDMSTLDECYMIRATAEDGTTEEYYAFMQNDRACLQWGKNGRYSLIDDKYYTAIKQMMDAQVNPAAAEVEKNLSIIMSSPATSSNPGDYMKAHQKEYENILEMGDSALSYMLSCFNNGEGNTLKGYIMMFLCSDLLGDKSNLTGQNLLPAEWYAKLEIRAETNLPDFVYTGGDPITKLVYETETAHNQAWGSGFTVVAVHEFGRFEEGDKLKVVVTTFSAGYHLYGKNLDMYTASVVPAAITYVKNADSTYTLSDYKQAEDGSYYAPSVRDFCTMPVSGNTIAGLADEVLRHYGSDSDLKALQKSNLEDLLKQNGITEISLPD